MHVGLVVVEDHEVLLLVNPQLGLFDLIQMNLLALLTAPWSIPQTIALAGLLPRPQN